MALVIKSPVPYACDSSGRLGCRERLKVTQLRRSQELRLQGRLTLQTHLRRNVRLTYTRHLREQGRFGSLRELIPSTELRASRRLSCYDRVDGEWHGRS